MRGLNFGFSLEEIRQWLLLYEEKGTDVEFSVFIEYADRQIAELEKERATLAETIADLTALRDETQDILDQRAKKVSGNSQS